MRTTILILLICILYSCKTKTVYTPIESVRTEYKDRVSRDSIFMHDSIIIRMKQDTVWLEKYKFAYRDKLRIDSIFISDTVQVPYPVVEYKEVNKINSWQHFLIWCGVISIAGIGIRIAIRYFLKK